MQSITTGKTINLADGQDLAGEKLPHEPRESGQLLLARM
jgi:hypothetical protein